MRVKAYTGRGARQRFWSACGDAASDAFADQILFDPSYQSDQYSLLTGEIHIFSLIRISREWL